MKKGTYKMPEVASELLMDEGKSVDFPVAFQLLLSNVEMRRESWAASQRIAVEENRIVMYIGDSNTGVWRPLEKDLMGEDWVIFSQEEEIDFEEDIKEEDNDDEGEV